MWTLTTDELPEKLGVYLTARASNNGKGIIQAVLIFGNNNLWYEQPLWSSLDPIEILAWKKLEPFVLPENRH